MRRKQCQIGCSLHQGSGGGPQAGSLCEVLAAEGSLCLSWGPEFWWLLWPAPEPSMAIGVVGRGMAAGDGQWQGIRGS